MKQMIPMFVAFASAVAFADPADPQISNVVLSQDELSRRVAVTYTLDEPAIVTMDVLTNGVSIGDANVQYVSGDCNRLVSAGDHGLKWAPDKSWPDHRFTKPVVSVRLTAWATNAPPMYMIVDLASRGARYYVSADALPDGGLANDIYKKTKLVLRRIPATNVEWTMGSPETEAGSAPFRSSETPHKVTLTRDYYMAVYPMTQLQYETVCGSNPSVAKGDSDSPVRPVENISWVDLRGEVDPKAGPAASSFLGIMRSHTAVDFDLPTDAQYEFACRAGTGTAHYNGNLPVQDSYYFAEDEATMAIAWYDACSSGKTQPVGRKQQNAFGLYDMLGNVMEWCRDRWSEGMVYGTDAMDPLGPDGDSYYRVSRGGASPYQMWFCRSAARGSNTWGSRSEWLGFRVMCPALAY